MKHQKHTFSQKVNFTKKRTWFFLNIGFTTIYLIWRFFFTIPLEHGWVSIIAGVSLFAVELLGMIEALIHYANMYTVEPHPVPEVPFSMLPDVDIFIATYNEPEDILYKTVNGCLHIKYPDRNKVHIYICDDGRRSEIKALAEKTGVGYISRDNNEHAKAGNLNNAMSFTSSPYVVTLDADMIPRSNFLLRTIPFFVQQEIENEGKEEKDKKHIGFVQSPQAFYNPDLFQFNLYSEQRIPNEQDYFYRDIQVSRNRSNSVIYGGSNTAISRRAIEEIGGFYTGTITEDYGTGILIQKKGYICYAIDEVLASGLSPTSLKSLIDQRIRWARGVISTNRKLHVVFSSELSFAQKCNYWASEWYWFAPLKRLIYFISPLLYATFGYIVIECTLWQILLFWLPMYISSDISLRMLSRNIRTTKWTRVYETVLFPYMLIPVLLESVGITMKKFKVTQKGKVENEAGKNMLYLLPFLLLILLSVIGIANCVYKIFENNDMGPVVVLFWLCLNFYTLMMSVFFVMGRNFMRRSERAVVEMDCKLITGDAQYLCSTEDISENGIALRLFDPVSIDNETDVTLELSDGRYEATVKARSVHVDKRRGYWKYGFHITDYYDNYPKYLQLLYDRTPTLPQSLSGSSGSFDDVKINVVKRAKKPFYQNRRFPRVTISAQLPDGNGNMHTLTEFDFKYCVIKFEGEPQKHLDIVVDADKDVVLHCAYTRDITEGKALYAVKNHKKLYDDSEKKLILEKWVSDEWHAFLETLEDNSQPVSASVEETKDTKFDEMQYL